MLSLASRHSECNYYPLVSTEIILMLERRIDSFDSQLPPLTITCLPVHCICSMLEAVLKFGLCANITFNPIPMLYATIFLVCPVGTIEETTQKALLVLFDFGK